MIGSMDFLSTGGPEEGLMFERLNGWFLYSVRSNRRANREVENCGSRDAVRGPSWFSSPAIIKRGCGKCDGYAEGGHMTLMAGRMSISVA